VALPEQDLAGQRVLITGVTGFIASALARRMNAAGATVIGLCRTPAKGQDLVAEGVELLQGDITDVERLDEVFRQPIDIVMHVAAWMRGTSTTEAKRVNVDATRCLAELSAAHGIKRFVSVSSITVYGLHGDADVDESAALMPYGDPYGDSKIWGEAAVKEVGTRTGLDFAIVRPGMVYGPGSRGWTKRMAIWAKSGWMPLVDGGSGTAYPIFIDNLVDLLMLCATHPDAKGLIFNAVDDGPVTLAQYLGAYMAMIPTKRALYLPGWVVSAAAAIVHPFLRDLNYHYVANQMRGRGQVLNAQAKEVLGWEPRVSLEEGMRRSEVWLRAEGIL
jgi:nucleoside-diphosphate-sugar epimerase